MPRLLMSDFDGTKNYQREMILKNLKSEKL